MQFSISMMHYFLSWLVGVQGNNNELYIAGVSLKMFGRGPKLDEIASVQSGLSERPCKELERSTSEAYIYGHFHIGLVV